MNAITRNLLFLILLSGAILTLPACGTKTNVNSEKVPETVLNPEQTPVSSGEIGMPGENTAVHTYVEKIHRTKNAKSGTTITTTPLASTTAPTPVPTPVVNQTPAMETAAPVKKSSGSHWLLWVLVLAVLGGIGWYFWNKSREGHYPTQPMPPTGGLSPVSGFTALKDQIEDESKSEPSIWTKKLF